MKYIILANLHHQDGKEIHKHTLKKNKINKDIHTQVQNTEPHFWGKKAALPIISLPNLHQQGRKETHNDKIHKQTHKDQTQNTDP